ncbi:MAG: glutamate-1-semialdehyde 2,1-aminomutase [Deltaproteobacteria bacterium]|nr:glutamate-1-semialdehyde 2,1-aminomutase [Deltaproteobacteria bacterium]
MSDTKSRELFGRAKQVIPGGVNSPVRAFRAVGGEPVFIKEAAGSKIVGADGTEYIDFVSSWGPLVAGHAREEVVNAVAAAAKQGTSYGAPTELEVQLAEKICACVESVDMVRLTSSGTEATMSALRLARGFNGRDAIVKMEGCYHGHADHLLVKAGSGLATFGEPDSAGVPADFAGHTLTTPYNDPEAIAAIFSEHGERIAAVIIEPVAGNMGVIPPDAGYLEKLRSLCDEHGALLIFDEVITGFRLGLGGAQAKYGVLPDLSCFGKIIGGGLPVGAFGGRRDVMERLAPLGPVYQAGTLSGNPLAVSAGLAVLSILEKQGIYEKLDSLGARLGDGFLAAAKEAGITASINRVESMMTLFFGEGPVRNFENAAACDTEKFALFHQAMLGEGIYLAPSAFEATFVSLAHTEAEIDIAVEAAHKVLRSIA